MKKIIAFVPVRGGSKSIPHKNIMPLCGKPLLYWSLNALEKTICIDEIIVATDSDDIEKVALSFSFQKVRIYRRLSENATDTASTESVILEYLHSGEANLADDDIFILVQATSPFTQPIHFEEALTMYLDKNYDAMLSCVRQKRFLWNENGTPVNYHYQQRPRRQEFDGYLLENGAFYINRTRNIIRYQNRLSGKIGIYEMPEYTALELDEPNDWHIIDKMMQLHLPVFQQKITNKPSIKLFLTDVDGVLTDGSMYYSETGDELKKFNTRDGMAFEILRERGIKTGIITGENTQIVKNRATKLKVDYLFQGQNSSGKLASAKEICLKEGISLDEVAYIGDDINCFDLLENVGIKACPSDACDKVKNIDSIIILTKKGGEGAVREFIENSF